MKFKYLNKHLPIFWFKDFYVLPTKKLFVIASSVYQEIPKDEKIIFEQQCRFIHKSRKTCNYWFLKIFLQDFRIDQDVSAYAFGLNHAKKTCVIHRARIMSLIAVHSEYLQYKYHVDKINFVKRLYKNIKL